LGIDCGRDHDQSSRSQAIAYESVPNSSRDGDDAAGSFPEEAALEWEDDPPGHYDRGAGKPTGETGQRERVGVVGVEKGTRVELPENLRNDPGIEPGPPGCRDNPNSGARKTAGQLTARRCYNDLVQSSAVQLASEQPDLPLPAAPLSARGDVNDWRDQVPGSMASDPLSRATSASNVRSSDRLNGLWR
jgi:hypothetical protein